ncbi:hypothetical protein AGMMS49545_17830 [Betaproteobacteria bacterium]|nr:hypothetical protein AGMMS49545_17830 [Betaproteobacteria bacterium]GHU44842.1 hypothetical protein AGMMS50289_14190 [Betaproteobacteria bacterium]
MATYKQDGKVWRVQACVKGVRGSATRPTKREAIQWAAQFALDVENRLSGIVPDVPFSVVLERYKQQVSPKKRTGAREVKRMDFFLRDALAAVPLRQLSAVHFSDWRDRRLRNVSAGSVLRDWSLMSHILAVAMKEWRMIKENPLAGVARW